MKRWRERAAAVDGICYQDSILMLKSYRPIMYQCMFNIEDKRRVVLDRGLRAKCNKKTAPASEGAAK